MESQAGFGITTILVDHNIEGQAVLLQGTLASAGWLDFAPLRVVTFREVGLAFDSTDRDVWRFAQAQRMLLLTDNRSMTGHDSLEQTIREENSPTALPVVTISRVGRIEEGAYRERCAVRLVEIASELERYLGTGRLFIP
jgi:hypothetical protein